MRKNAGMKNAQSPIESSHEVKNPSPPSLTMGWVEWGLLISLSIVWGGSFLFGRIAVLEIPPLTLVFLRVSLAALALHIYVLFVVQNGSRKPAPWRDFALMGLFNNIIPFSLIFYGQQEIGAGLAAIVNAMTPIWALIFAHFTTSDERIALRKIFGILLGFIGVTALIGQTALDGLSASVWAQIAVLGATISYGVASVFGRRFAELPPVETAKGQLTMSSLLIIPLMLWFEQPWQISMPSGAAIVSTILLALVCTAFAYILFFEILKRAGAVNVALVTLLIPPSAILLGGVFLGEQLTMGELWGMALILAGLLVIDGRLLDRFR